MRAGLELPALPYSLFSLNLFPAIWARTLGLLRCPAILQFVLQLLRFAYEFSSYTLSSCSWVDESIRNYMRNYFEQKPIITRHCTRLQCVYVSVRTVVSLQNWSSGKNHATSSTTNAILEGFVFSCKLCFEFGEGWFSCHCQCQCYNCQLQLMIYGLVL